MTLLEAQDALNTWRFMDNGRDVFGCDAAKLTPKELLKLAALVSDVKRLAHLKRELSKLESAKQQYSQSLEANA